MAFTEWTNQNIYSSDCGCGCKSSSNTSSSDCGCGCEENKCGCCAPGLVEVRDPSTNKIVGCLTPNDAEGYMLNVAPPPAGYVRWVNAGVFMGFVTPADYLLLTA
jgi:hypothetical protein